MRTILTIALLCHYTFGFTQYQLEVLGTVGDINAKAKATNSHPLLVVQNVVYSIPDECFCNRDLNVEITGRNLGDDDLDRKKGNRNADRNAGIDDSERNKGDDNSNRNLGTDFIYRDSEDDGTGRGSGTQDSKRDSDTDNSNRNADIDNADRKSDTDVKGRNSGSASKSRDAGNDNLERGFSTSHIPPSCQKLDDSCSFQIIGFHPKANIEYFDKIESIKANSDMVIEF